MADLDSTNVMIFLPFSFLALPVFAAPLLDQLADHTYPFEGSVDDLLLLSGKPKKKSPSSDAKAEETSELP